LLLYVITLRGTYIYDDVYVILEDDRIKSPAMWAQLWTKDYNNGGADNLYRPLTSMTYAVQWWLHGEAAWAFHLVNVMVHALASALVAMLAMRLATHAGMNADRTSPFAPSRDGDPRYLPVVNSHDETARPVLDAPARTFACLAGAMFAVHPIHVEAVAGIVGRAELLCVVFGVGSLVVYLKSPLTSARAWAVWGLVLLSILSKEQGLIVPALIGLLAWRIRVVSRATTTDADTSRPTTAGSDTPPTTSTADARPPLTNFPAQSPARRAGLLLALLLCWTVAGYIVLRESILHLKFFWDRSFLDWSQNPLVRSDADAWLVPISILGRYAQLLIAPVRLSIDYGGSVIGWHFRAGDPYFWMGVVVAALWAMGLLRSLLARKWVVAFCLLGFGTMYALVGNIGLIIGTIFGERLMYFPSVFIVLLMAMGLLRLPTRAGRVVACLLLILGSVRTFTYAARWNDATAFYDRSSQEQPQSVRLHMLVADAARDRGDYAKAERACAAGREVLPDYFDIYSLSGEMAEQQGKLVEARDFYQKAFDLWRNVITYQRLMRVDGLLREKKG